MTSGSFRIGNVARIDNGNIRHSGTAGGDLLLYGEGQDVYAPTEEHTVHIDGGAGDITLTVCNYVFVGNLTIEK